MEVKITKFFNQLDEPQKFSGSIHELGEDAAKETWGNAIEEARVQYNLLDTCDKADAFKAHMQAMGFSEEGNFLQWSPMELNALFIQLISGDIRDSEGLTNKDWDLVQKESEEGQCSGNIFKGTDGEIYYELGE